MYLVSILVPVYKVEKYIEQCARSLFEQTYDNLEYIFVDDCSPDNSIEILNRVMDDYPERKAQVRIIRHERNRGLAAVRNTALDAMQGSFLSHVDSDDYLDSDAIRLLVNKQVETGADIVTGNFYHIVGSNEIEKQFEAEYKDKQEMLAKTLSFPAGTHVVWRRLINSRLYKDFHIRPKEGVNNGEDCQQISQLVYFANKVARISDHIYYYNRTNEYSYYFLSTCQSNPDLWEQYVESLLILEDFFSDKEQMYQDLLRRGIIYVIKTRMSLAARFRQRESFDKLKTIIMTKYADCYDEIGWDNPLLRAFMCNYTLNSYYRRFLNTIKICLHL